MPGALTGRGDSAQGQLFMRRSAIALVLFLAPGGCSEAPDDRVVAVSAELLKLERTIARLDQRMDLLQSQVDALSLPATNERVETTDRQGDHTPSPSTSAFQPGRDASALESTFVKTLEDCRSPNSDFMGAANALIA